MLHTERASQRMRSSSFFHSSECALPTCAARQPSHVSSTVMVHPRSLENEDVLSQGSCRLGFHLESGHNLREAMPQCPCSAHVQTGVQPPSHPGSVHLPPPTQHFTCLISCYACIVQLNQGTDPPEDAPWLVDDMAAAVALAVLLCERALAGELLRGKPLALLRHSL